MEFNQTRMEIKPRKKVEKIIQTKNNANHQKQCKPPYGTHWGLNSKICTGPGDSRQEVCALSSPPQLGWIFGHTESHPSMVPNISGWCLAPGEWKEWSFPTVFFPARWHVVVAAGQRHMRIVGPIQSGSEHINKTSCTQPIPLLFQRNQSTPYSG